MHLKYGDGIGTGIIFEIYVDKIIIIGLALLEGWFFIMGKFSKIMEI